MLIKRLAHSCFLLQSEGGTRILTDPCDPATGYNVGPVEADCVTESHQHHDHNYTAAAKGRDVKVISAPGEYTVGDVKITGIPCWHDEMQGAKRGSNIIFVFEMDGLRLAHMGDIGHLPDEATLKAMGHIDILLIPVGGIYTVDYKQALEIAYAIAPKVVIPMHYAADKLAFELGELAPFLENAKNCAIHRMRQSEAVITRESLGSNRIIVLDCAA